MIYGRTEEQMCRDMCVCVCVCVCVCIYMLRRLFSFHNPFVNVKVLGLNQQQLISLPTYIIPQPLLAIHFAPSLVLQLCLVAPVTRQREAVYIRIVPFLPSHHRHFATARANSVSKGDIPTCSSESSLLHTKFLHSNIVALYFSMVKPTALSEAKALID
jgi:hypothetical protein